MSHDTDQLIQLQQGLQTCLSLADELGANLAAIRIAEAIDALKAMQSPATQIGDACVHPIRSSLTISTETR